MHLAAPASALPSSRWVQEECIPRGRTYPLDGGGGAQTRARTLNNNPSLAFACAPRFPLQLGSDALTLLSPLLLKLLVEWLSSVPEPPPPPYNDGRHPWATLCWQLLSPSGAYFGWTAALALGLSCVLRALLNSHFNWGLVSARGRGGGTAPELEPGTGGLRDQLSW